MIGEFIPQSGLVGLWHLNGNSTDSSGVGNNGSDTNISYEKRVGMIKEGAVFNNSGTSIISISNTQVMSTFSISFRLIILTLPTTDNRYISNKYPASNDANLGISITNTGKLQVVSYQNGSSYMTLESSSSLSINTLYEISVNVNEASSQIWINGKLDKSGTLQALNFGSIVVFGANAIGGPSNYRLNMVMDEYALFSRIRSASEIKKWYAWSRGKYL